LGELLVFVSYLGQFYEPLNQLSHVGATASSAAAGTQRVFEILDTPVEIQESPTARPLCDARKTTTPVDKPVSVIAPHLVRGKIEFEQVSFGYQPGQTVLNKINLEVNPGETVALIGPSGAGKSTLIHLLPRFFDPTEGKVLLDGMDLRDLRLHELRQQIALVMQDSLLLPGTVAENIGFGKQGATQQEIEAAAQAANAAFFIERLPKGYNTLVGEGAARLSVGEKQRISLARAFLKDAPIVLLDEPTSSLDAENEELVMKSLQTLMRGRTSIIVAHRLSTIRHAHKIFVIEQGRIVESGAPGDLLRSSGYYARVANVGKAI
jgi:ABC-type multidrug transport system fused ATPase/permease subunit